MPAIGGSSSNAPYKISDVGAAFTGPLIGAQFIYPITFTPIASKVTAGGDIIHAFQAPCDMRLERISWFTNLTLGAASDLLFFLKHATAGQTSGATSLISTASQAITTTATDFIVPSGETIGTTTATISTTAGVRDIAKGNFVMLAYTTDATPVTAGTVITVLLTFVMNGFSNVNGSSN